MTYEEAKERVLAECESCADNEDCECLQDSDCFEYKTTIVEALNKQIPKKPTEQGKSPEEENYKFGGCPICTATVFGDMHFCDNCGQAIDWSDENEMQD